MLFVCITGAAVAIVSIVSILGLAKEMLKSKSEAEWLGSGYLVFLFMITLGVGITLLIVGITNWR